MPQLYDDYEGSPFQVRQPWIPGASSYGMNIPGQTTDSAWNQPEPGAFTVTSSGLSGTGVPGPKPQKGDGKMTESAANLLARGPATQPPPGMNEPPARYSGSGPDPALLDKPDIQQPPPGFQPDTRADEAITRIQSRTAPRMIGERDLQGNLRPQDAVDPNNLQGKEKTGAKVGSWAQRLAMAVLAATKLAPAAMQIVHPEYSQQMGQYQAANAADTGLIKDIDSAENAKSQAVYRDAEGERQREQAANYAEGQQTKRDNAKLSADVKRQADFTRSLGKPEDLIEHIGANDPQIPQLTAQGWQILDDIRYPEGSGMKVAKPPATIQVNAQNAPILTGHQIGEIIPWSEYKSSLAAYQKQQQELELEKARVAGKTVDAEQQFVNEFISKNPGASIAQAQHAYAVNHQPPERAPQPTPQQYVVPDGQGGHKLVVIAPGQSVPEGAVSQSGFSAGNTPTSQMRSRGEMAKTVTAQIPQILNDIDALKDKIGPGAGRWNQLWVNKGGMKDPDFAGLDQDLKMLSSGILITHFGMRGNAAAREALEKNFGEAQSPEDLKARIQHADKWLDGYANATKVQTPAGGNTPAATPQRPANVPANYHFDSATRTWRP